ncbi:hypothetical protein ARMSODRAFT_1022494 [Armillaria solidipes]|uniref:Peptidase C14 caspase domain-containing protein n=1 Tax=Armillaria solidipes TaxID=1076256 RepID=A0A2H3B5U5_9AGAR|nr:hypothetical protein ARMSODRAFT_1022494 [Armillaria solidipes]
MKAKDAVGGLASTTGVNTDIAIEGHDVPSSATSSDPVLLPCKQLRPVHDVPTSNVWQAVTLIMAKLWGAITVTVCEIRRIDPYSRYHILDSNGDTLAKGFAPDAYSAGGGKTPVQNTIHDPPTHLTTEEIYTDYGDALQQARIQALSLRNSWASRYYKACHQKLASLSQYAYETRLHPPKVVTKFKKQLFSFSGPRSSHGSKPNGHQFWAVLIGIDGYTNPLRGCVADAYIIEEYLTNVLHIPTERIQYLLGKRPDDSPVPISHKNSLPTRANIIDTLLGLSTNSKINKGDSIIIFFSGHGSSYYCPECYRTIFGSHPPDPSAESASANENHRHRCPIEALCPIDRGTPDGQGACIPDISDREINNIVTYIYRAKDARITIILDCCHAGGSTRAPLNGDVRTAHSLPHEESFVRMLNSAKERMGDWHGYRDVWEDKWIPDMDSHIVLAACKDYQFAKEWPDRNGYSGVFTRALVKVLRSDSLTEEATYVDVIESLPIFSGQTPVLAGKRVQERLWL